MKIFTNFANRSPGDALRSCSVAQSASSFSFGEGFMIGEERYSSQVYTSREEDRSFFF